jgi:hypothetical protein
MTFDVGRPASKAALRLARARLPSMGKPGLRRFCAGDAYSAAGVHTCGPAPRRPALDEVDGQTRR